MDFAGTTDPNLLHECSLGPSSSQADDLACLASPGLASVMKTAKEALRNVGPHSFQMIVNA